MPTNFPRIPDDGWEEWFAWFPVVINGERVWLRYVERREIFSYRAECWIWAYREIR